MRRLRPGVRQVTIRIDQALDDAFVHGLLVSRGCAGEADGGVDGHLGKEASAERFADDELAVMLPPDSTAASTSRWPGSPFSVRAARSLEAGKPPCRERPPVVSEDAGAGLALPRVCDDTPTP
jgi:hypothetical protein